MLNQTLSTKTAEQDLIIFFTRQIVKKTRFTVTKSGCGVMQRYAKGWMADRVELRISQNICYAQDHKVLPDHTRIFNPRFMSNCPVPSGFIAP